MRVCPQYVCVCVCVHVFCVHDAYVRACVPTCMRFLQTHHAYMHSRGKTTTFYSNARENIPLHALACRATCELRGIHLPRLAGPRPAAVVPCPVAWRFLSIAFSALANKFGAGFSLLYWTPSKRALISTKSLPCSSISFSQKS